MYLKSLEVKGFKSFAKNSKFVFDVPIVAIVGPNGSGKSNVVEAIRFVLGEQSVKSMRGKIGSDLIFKGSKTISKMSRAFVNITFDNSDRVFHLHKDDNSKINIDFDEITISREVFSDGTNRYMINGNDVRMKDIHELISSVNIGSSGHHIISQGEADRYLNANLKDRKVFIEEALGLKIYQYRLSESYKKIEKSLNNLRESEILRRELSPHLRFLKRQVAKIEKAKQLRLELLEKYHDYFIYEDLFIKTKRRELDFEKQKLESQMEKVNLFILQNTKEKKQNNSLTEEEEKIKEKKKIIQKFQKEIDTYHRELGKVEGMILFYEKENNKTFKEKDIVFPYIRVKKFLYNLIDSLNIINTENIKYVINEVKDNIDEFLDSGKTNIQQAEESLNIFDLNKKRESILNKINMLASSISDAEDKISFLESKLIKLRNEDDIHKKQYYQYIALKKELEAKGEILSRDDDMLNKRIISRDDEYREAIALLGEEKINKNITSIDDELVNNSFNEENQEILRREIERIKIKLEDIGGGSGIELIKEYEETLNRDKFLEKEILDINNTIESLNSIISSIKSKLDIEFNEGLKKINIQFNRFFSLMFNGGSASLEKIHIQRKNKKNGEDIDFLNNEESDIKDQNDYGIDIKVNLPRKKVSDLNMLSGGERSLTSIALLFALSQVNPPPFLVLDETDAALDEANSNKYGEMIEELSKVSQLILVTHNRETMSRAHTLFGITLGRDDASTMLSLRLEDATKYAK